MNSTSENQTVSGRQMLRHTIATLAYRGGKSLRGAPSGFANFRAEASARTPGEILAHVGDLLDWALSLVKGKQEWRGSDPLPWEQEKARFFAGLEALDAYLASDAPLGCSADQIFQGPIADGLTHVGQISMLRRLAGFPVRAENFLQADIRVGRVGAEQTAARREFD
jgi:hypothetical protein